MFRQDRPDMRLSAKRRLRFLLGPDAMALLEQDAEELPLVPRSPISFARPFEVTRRTIKAAWSLKTKV